MSTTTSQPHCHQLRRHATFGHSIGNDPRGLPRSGHVVSDYVVTPLPYTSTSRLQALRRQRPLGTPSGATSSWSHHLYLRRDTTSAYIVSNDPRVHPQGLPRVGHATSIYGGTLPSLTSSAMTLGYSLRGYLESVTPPLSTVAHHLHLHHRQ